MVWQQGKLNNSNLYYTAAKYSKDGNLQWLQIPQSLTADQVGDLEPTVTVVNGANSSSVIVVGSKVNFENASNQRIREDSDFYSQSFGISGSQFQDSSSAVSPLANYSPQWSRDGVINLGVLANNPQTNYQAPQASTQLRLTLATSKSANPGWFHAIQLG